ncbi:MAG: hydrogenase maturation protease [Bacteroidales bacterium]|nr:hydrogenase maturation protease [Bacteroidales bacterium]
MATEKRILVYGYGNPGRQDDGLGVEMVKMIDAWIEKHGISCMTSENNYQLNVEDAETISKMEYVVFVDASKEDIREYRFRKVEPSDKKLEFTMHAVSPAYVLNLSKELFDKTPETYILAIKGYEWDFSENLSDNAKLNLEQAYQFLIRKLSNWSGVSDNLPISMLRELA